MHSLQIECCAALTFPHHASPKQFQITKHPHSYRTSSLHNSHLSNSLSMDPFEFGKRIGRPVGYGGKKATPVPPPRIPKPTAKPSRPPQPESADEAEAEASSSASQSGRSPSVEEVKPEPKGKGRATEPPTEEPTAPKRRASASMRSNTSERYTSNSTRPAARSRESSAPSPEVIPGYEAWLENQPNLRDPEEVKSKGSPIFITDDTPIMTSREAQALQDDLIQPPSGSRRTQRSQQPPAQPFFEPSSSRTMSHQDDGVRLQTNNLRIRLLVSKACGNGSNYKTVTKLTGADNWGLFSSELKNAARLEQTSELLRDEDPMCEPPQPAEDCPTHVWNTWVEDYVYFHRLNDNLLSGIQMCCDPYYNSKVQDVKYARDAYNLLKTECRQQGASGLGEIVSSLITDNLSRHNSVKDYSEAFLTKTETLNRMDLPWEIPDQLLQLWFLANLGESFGTFRSSIFLHFKVAGVGNGPEIKLRELMTKAQDEWLRMQSEQRMATGQPSAFYTNSGRPQHRQGVKRPSDQPSERSAKRAPTYKPKPAHYTGPFQKVCDYHGWLDRSSNHSTQDCIVLKRQRGEKPPSSYLAADYPLSSADDKPSTPSSEGLKETKDGGSYFTDLQSWPIDLGDSF